MSPTDDPDFIEAKDSEALDNESAAIKAEELEEGDPCPLCGQPLVLRRSERGDFLGCSDYPACSFMQPLSKKRSVETVLDMEDHCPKCGALVALKRGRFGLFVGCTRYPDCDYTYTGHEKSQIKCPLCHKGVMSQRFTRTGRLFYACTNYPECTYSVPGKPKEEPCPQCSFPLQFEKKGKNGIKLVCGNSLCKTRRPHKRKRKEILDDPTLRQGVYAP